jgi:signal transduction histidine kinase
MVKNILQILKQQISNIILLSILITFFILCLSYSYLLFHIFIELFSVVIAFSLFIITWNSRKILDNQYLFFIGIVALFIGILDTFHIVTYQGMNIIKSPVFYANQFWIATRFLESIAILTGFFFLNKKINLHAHILIAVLTVITILIILSIVYWEVFPACYIENVGQTNFKIYSEYVIIFILFIALYFLTKNKASFENNVYKLLFASIIFAIITEFSFTLYVSNFSFSNQIGHFTKLFTFYFIYKANVETGFIKPAEIIFSNLKNSEKRFRKQSKELAELNKKYLAINEELENKIEEINTLVESKDKFFGIIAHDLKQPFTSLLGFSNLLKDNASKYSPEKVQQFAQNMNSSAAYGFKLLENLLEWARLQTGTINPHLIKLKPSEIINEVKPLKEQIAKSKNIDFQTNIESDEYILADREMIKTVLRNLISNALKFTSSEGIVKVTTRSAENNMIFEISDTGVGIEKQHLDKIFDIDNNLSKKGTAGEKGTGLGLTLCKEFVEKNKGKISVESEIGKGSSFIFTIPLFKE